MGYIDNRFDDKVEQAVIKFKEAAGFPNANGVVTLNMMKALMTMDAFALLSGYGGTETVRTFQQWLNRHYEAYIGWMPCDGIYGRNTNKAVIYAIQKEEGIPVGTANGLFGPSTRSCLPTIPYNNVAGKYGTGAKYTASEMRTFIEIMQFGLHVNGFGDGARTGVFDAATQRNLAEFKNHHALAAGNTVDLGTWLSIYTSAGDANRSAQACDTATILTPPLIQTLHGNGYRVVGRYLTGTMAGGVSKALTHEEISRIFAAGMGYFPIYQAGGTSASYFNEQLGQEAAHKAYVAASDLRVPSGTTIYFAVDFDALDVDITSSVIPHFRGINTVMQSYGYRYRVGIYGARNVCSRVAGANLSTASFVSDMSTGFSGNLGFKIPDNWTFDQFANVVVYGPGGHLEIDKVAMSPRAQYVTSHGGGGQGTTQFERDLTRKVMEYENLTKDMIGQRIAIPYHWAGKKIPFKSALMPENGQRNYQDLIRGDTGVSDLSTLTAAQFSTLFQNVERYGVDCSGFSYYCLNEATGGAMQRFMEPFVRSKGGDISEGQLTYEYGISAGNQQHEEFTVVSKAQDVQPGDCIRMKDVNGVHIVVVYHVEKNSAGVVERIDIAHSSRHHGPHTACIYVRDPNSDLRPRNGCDWDDPQYNSDGGIAFLNQAIQWISRAPYVEEATARG